MKKLISSMAALGVLTLGVSFAAAQGPGIIDGRGIMDGGGVLDRAPGAGIVDGGGLVDGGGVIDRFDQNANVRNNYGSNNYYSQGNYGYAQNQMRSAHYGNYGNTYGATVVGSGCCGASTTAYNQVGSGCGVSTASYSQVGGCGVSTAGCGQAVAGCGAQSSYYPSVSGCGVTTQAYVSQPTCCDSRQASKGRRGLFRR